MMESEVLSLSTVYSQQVSYSLVLGKRSLLVMKVHGSLCGLEGDIFEYYVVRGAKVETPGVAGWHWTK